MKIKAAFVGNDKKYFDRVWKALKLEYTQLELERIDIPYNAQDPKEVFIYLNDQEADIIYIDYSDDFAFAFALSKFINKNNEMREKATVALFEYSKNMTQIKKALNAEMRLYHYKMLEINDVVNDPVSILDVNMAHEPEFFSCEEFQEITLLQPMRIGFVGENHFHIETNSYLKVGDILEVDTHPLIDIMPSRKVYISNFTQRDLFYNKRFAYDLEFIYIDNDFFSRTNKNWLMYKELKTNPSQQKKLDKHTQTEILEDMEKRKRAFSPIRTRIDEWLEEHKNKLAPKQVKIMIIDDTLEFMREIKGPIEDFPYLLNVQTKLTHNYYQILRTMPQIIVIKQDEEVNTQEVYLEIINKIKSIEDYQPYVLVFNTKDSCEVLNANRTYSKMLCHEGPLHLDEVRKMAKLLDEKMKISEVKNKVFPTSHDDFSLMLAKKSVKVIHMNESIMYIHSEDEIPMWTNFLVQKPVPLMLTIVPHKDDSEYKQRDHVYCCLINGIGEMEKNHLRRIINATIAKNQADD